MTAFEPGEGFREVDWLEYQAAGVGSVRYDDTDGPRFWVREEPVPALPTWTVIRYPSRGVDDPSSVHINTPAGWALVQGKSLQFNARGWQPHDGYEVLAEPVREVDREAEYSAVRDVVRRETAKTVIARIAAQPWAREVDLQKLRDEFGVES